MAGEQFKSHRVGGESKTSQRSFDNTHLLFKVNFFISFSCGAGLHKRLAPFFLKKHLDCKKLFITFGSLYLQT